MVPKHGGLPRDLGIPSGGHSHDGIDCSTGPPHLHGVAVPQGADSLEGIDSHRILHHTHPSLLFPLLLGDKRGAHTSVMGGHGGDSPGRRMKMVVDQVGPAGVPRQVPHDHYCCRDTPQRMKWQEEGGGSCSSLLVQ